MKHFYKGDIIANKKDTEFHWGVTFGQLFIVTYPMHGIDDTILIYRPFRNIIKHFLWKYFIIKS